MPLMGIMNRNGRDVEKCSSAPLRQKKPAPHSRPQPGLLEFGCDRGPASCFFIVLSGSLMSKEFKINQRSRLLSG